MRRFGSQAFALMCLIFVACVPGEGPVSTRTDAITLPPTPSPTPTPPPPQLNLAVSARKLSLSSTGVPTSFQLFQATNLSRDQLFGRASNSFQLGANDLMVERSVVTAPRGFVYSKFQQTYRGVPVEGALYALTEASRTVISGHGRLAPGLTLSVTPAIPAATALTTALAQINATTYRWQTDPAHYAPPVGELTIRSSDFGASAPFLLAWRFVVRASQPWGSAVAWVDAQTGAILDIQTRAPSADAPASGSTLAGVSVNFTADQVSPGSYRLQEASTRKIATLKKPLNAAAVSLTDTDNVWSEPAVRAGVSAHWAAEKFWDYLQARFAMPGLDGLGTSSPTGVVINLVSAAEDGCVKYGTHYEASDRIVSLCEVGGVPEVELLTVAHELGHQLHMTASQEVLGQAQEPRAVDESIADVFATSVNNFAGSNTWVVYGRNMASPKTSLQPDTYGGAYWQSEGDEHLLDGVGNRFFFLLAMGGAGTNDLGFSYTVQGIGRQAAEAIVFGAAVGKLLGGDDYLAYRRKSIEAATEAFGVDSPQLAATQAAWDAVGVVDPTTTLAQRFRLPAAAAVGVEPWPASFILETPLSLCRGKTCEPEIEWLAQVSVDPLFSTSQTLSFTSLIMQGAMQVTTNTLNLQAGKVYYWRVKARRATSGWDATWRWTANFETARKSPRNVTPKDKATDVYPWPATFTWDPVDGATGYQAEAGPDADFSGAHAIEPVSTNSSSGLQLVQNMETFWRVRAKGPVGYGEWSSQIHSPGMALSADVLERKWAPEVCLSFTTAQPKVTFTQPTVGASSYPWPVGFGWNKVQGATEYELQVSADGDSAFSSALTLDHYTANGDETSGSVSVDPDPAKRFYWRVRAIGPSQQFTPWSNGDVATHQYFTPAAITPTLLAPIGGATVSSTNVHFSWSPVPGASKYLVRVYKVVPNVGAQQIAAFDVPAPTASYTLAGPLDEPAHYTWTLQALDAEGHKSLEASASPTGGFFTQPPPPNSSPTLACNTAVIAGGNVADERTFELGVHSGTIKLHYKTYDVHDQLIVKYQRPQDAAPTQLWSSGCVGTPNPTGDIGLAPWTDVNIPFQGTNTWLEVVVQPNCDATALPTTQWTYKIDCP